MSCCQKTKDRVQSRHDTFYVSNMYITKQSSFEYFSDPRTGTDWGPVTLKVDLAVKLEICHCA